VRWTNKIELNRAGMNERWSAGPSLFKAWFVDAHRDRLPKGWREGSFLEVEKLLSGGRPKPSERLLERRHFLASAKDVRNVGKPSC